MLTKECDYAIRIIRSLAGGMRRTVEAISSAEHIPHQYAYKILKKLEKAGYVRGIRGREGGYRIAKDLESFTLFDVVVAIDKNLFVNECLRANHQCPHHREDSPCAVHMEFARIQEIFLRELQSKNMHMILSH